MPRSVAIEKIIAHTNEPIFDQLLIEATNVELDNLAALSRDEQRLFPLRDIGVAQGSCLSPLLCNILLAEFDEMMNSRGIVCVRYIDDFIIFAKDRRSAFKAFDGAIKYLNDYGLSAYNPESAEEIGKAECGFTKEGFDFLGCRVGPKSVVPSKVNRATLVGKIRLIVDEALAAIHLPEEAISRKRDYASAIRDISNTIRGWGNTFSFCTDDRIMRDIDSEILKIINEFNESYKRRIYSLDPMTRLRLLGIFCLDDCNKDAGADSIRFLISSAASK